MSNQNLSKFISLILRHKPETVGITLDEHGWADVEDLIDGIRESGREIDLNILEEIVRTDDKGRYSFNEDQTKIRANQGHSINVDVELREVVPPDILYHGTATRFLDSIKQDGIKSMSRQYVHLSGGISTAAKVGMRHGRTVVLVIDAKQMSDDGYGSPKVAMDLYLVGKDFWLERHDYDGSEWWEFKQMPVIATDGEKIKYLTVEQCEEATGKDFVGWITLAEMN